MQRNRHPTYDDRDRSKSWRGDEKRRRERSSHGREAEDDGNDFETYNYSYNSQSYLRSPYGDTKQKPKSSSKRYSAEKHEPHRGGVYETRHANIISGSNHRDIALFNAAATKIQAAFRGYRTRKEFWRRRERYRGMQNRDHPVVYRQDEYSLPSMTSIVDNSSVAALASNADPNLGLTTPLTYIDTTQRNHIIRDLKTKLTFSDDLPTANQLQSEHSPTIIVLGGINPNNAGDHFQGSSMFVYNVQKDRWLFAGTMPEPRNYHGAAFISGKLYITGGFSPLYVNHGQMVSTQSMFQLAIRSKRWRRRADMHQARACHGTCVIDENIMVLGGRDNTGKILSAVEVYYTKRDQWSLVKPMPEPIMGMACAVMDGCVWVLGGIVNEGQSTRCAVSNRVYTFDIEQQNWYHKVSLPEPRAYASAASLKREIWLWCGVKESLSDDGYLISSNTVYTFNPEIGKWDHNISIGTAKHAAALAKFGRRVYLLGGMSNVSGSKEVLAENDYYNRENDRYSEGAGLPRPMTGAAAAALPIDYIASSDPKWNVDNLNDTVMHQAATKIQSAFRGYRARSLLSNNKFPIDSSNSDVIQRRCFHLTDSAQNKWKLFQRVQIDDWPPLPDPKNLPSELDIRLGTLPKGYTITSAHSGARTKVRRYVPLPEHADPNLGMCGHICNVYKKTKKILGLRKVEHLPPFARDMLTVTTLQDDSLPVVLVMGGLQPKEPVNLSYGKLIMRYSPLKDRWEYFGVLPEPRNYHAAVYYREYIYVTGGCDPDKRNCGEMVATSTTYCLNIHSSEWLQKSEMNCTRSHHALVAFQGKLYAIGGRDHNGRLVASIEAYDIENDKWSLKRAMAQPRMGMACAVYNENIWCVGGIGLTDSSDTISYPVLSSVLSYDVAKDLWVSRPPLRCPRAYASCVAVNNTLWLIGGASRDRTYNALISMASVDKYYPDEAQWVRRTLLNIPRHSAAVVAVESCVYTFGGVSSQEWSALAKNEMVVLNDISLHGCKPLPIPLTGIAAVCVPPVAPSLRAESLAILLHGQLTFH